LIIKAPAQAGSEYLLMQPVRDEKEANMLRKKLLLTLVSAVTVLMVGNFIAANGLAQTWVNQPGSLRPQIPSAALKGDLDGIQQPIDVLFVVADDASGYGALRDALSMLPEIGRTDTFNSMAGTPTLDQLQGYQVTIVWAAFPHQDPDALGDVLADYVDSGGAVIASTPSRVPPLFFIGGRFLSGQYDPLFNGFGPLGPASLGTHIDHATLTTPYPINNLSGDAREGSSLRPEALGTAWWTDNNPLLAIKGAVAGDTAFLNNGSWSGDFPQLLANLCVFLTTPPASPKD
jgi:hypothetical protein